MPVSGKAKRSLLRRDDLIAGQRQLHAATEREAVEPRDDRDRAGLDAPEQPPHFIGEGEDAIEAPLLDVPHEEADVRAGDERLAHARQNDPAGRGVGQGLLQERAELGDDSGLSAFRTSGRWKVSVAIPSLISLRT